MEWCDLYENYTPRLSGTPLDRGDLIFPKKEQDCAVHNVFPAFMTEAVAATNIFPTSMSVLLYFVGREGASGS